MRLISIIVPVYNVEQYLDRCVKSLIAQTYKNIEIILVDDGSPDKSGHICDQYSKADSRIRVIHKTNGGLSSARNAGLDIAKGDLIGFVDSDDYVEPTMYERMIGLMDSENCNIVECAVNLLIGSKMHKYPIGDNEIISGNEALERQLRFDRKSDSSIPRIAVWSKLFNASFWKKHRFPEGHVHEDYLLVCQAFYESSKVGLIYEGLYNHLTDNPGSIMNSKFGKRDLYKEIQYKNRVNYLEKVKASKRLTDLAYARYYMILIELYWRCEQNHMEESKIYQNTIYAHFFQGLVSKLPITKKIEWLGISLTPKTYMNIRNVIMNKRA